MELQDKSSNFFEFHADIYLKKTNKCQFSILSFKPLSLKKKKVIFLSISLTILPPRGFDAYMIQSCLANYLNLPQGAEKQTKIDAAQTR